MALRRISYNFIRGTQGSNTTSRYAAWSIYPATPRARLLIASGHATTLKEGTGDALHLDTPVRTSGDQYELLPAVHAPMTVGVRQAVTRTYGKQLRNSKTILAVKATKSLCFTELKPKVNKTIRFNHWLELGWDGLWLCSDIAGILKVDTCLQKEPAKYLM